MMDDSTPIMGSLPAPSRRRWYNLRALRDAYSQRLMHTHGWEVELACPHCGLDALPVFDGWTPSTAIRFGTAPTILAKLSCRRCGTDLRPVAGGKLMERFAVVPTPRQNRQFLALFIGHMVAIELVASALIHWGKLWPLAMFLRQLPFYLLGPAILRLNWQIHSIRHRCECGQPAYKFMGLLGRSSCYRCSTCGRLLRLRD